MGFKQPLLIQGLMVMVVLISSMGEARYLVDDNAMKEIDTDSVKYWTKKSGEENSDGNLDCFIWLICPWPIWPIWPWPWPITPAPSSTPPEIPTPSEAPTPPLTPQAPTPSEAPTPLSISETPTPSETPISPSTPETQTPSEAPTQPSTPETPYSLAPSPDD